jgi:hypothetical protein
VPSGQVIRTGGMFSTTFGGSINIERQSKNFPHFLGFLALAILLVFWSTTAYVRSPRSPCSDTYEELSSSPSIDFTGYLHKETTVPTSVLAWFTILLYYYIIILPL